VQARRAYAEIEIDVIDDGPGIPAEQLEHIFERFTRGDAGETQRVGGTGLGLAISKSLVELHGGTIAASSAPGAGSAFRVRLSSIAAPAAAPTQPSRAEAS
jgi:signal transduction histidine kinase